MRRRQLVPHRATHVPRWALHRVQEQQGLPARKANVPERCLRALTTRSSGFVHLGGSSSPRTPGPIADLQGAALGQALVCRDQPPFAPPQLFAHEVCVCAVTRVRAQRSPINSQACNKCRWCTRPRCSSLHPRCMLVRIRRMPRRGHHRTREGPHRGSAVAEPFRTFPEVLRSPSSRCSLGNNRRSPCMRHLAQRTRGRRQAPIRDTATRRWHRERTVHRCSNHQ